MMHPRGDGFLIIWCVQANEGPASVWHAVIWIPAQSREFDLSASMATSNLDSVIQLESTGTSDWLCGHSLERGPSYGHNMSWWPRTSLARIISNAGPHFLCWGMSGLPFLGHLFWKGNRNGRLKELLAKRVTCLIGFIQPDKSHIAQDWFLWLFVVHWNWACCIYHPSIQLQLLRDAIS